ncbi:MAG: ABC transporter ATP-binding protein [Microthrixaceae bacterium]
MSDLPNQQMPAPGAPGAGVGTAPAPAARALGATKAYGSGDTQVLALNDVTVAFPTSRFTAIMGPSGSGKSTLMHCMAGLDTLTAGQVFIGDVDLSTLSDKERTLLRRERVGFVFQAFNLIPTLTAQENITLPLDLGGNKPDQGWLDTVVNTVGLADRLRHRPSELSGGQQQRVAVARAMATRPEIIFADEPTGNLDSASGAEVLGFMRSAVDDYGQSVVMVTHDPVAASYAHQVIFLADGRVVGDLQQPTAAAVLDRMKGLGS